MEQVFPNQKNTSFHSCESWFSRSHRGVQEHLWAEQRVVTRESWECLSFWSMGFVLYTRESNPLYLPRFIHTDNLHGASVTLWPPKNWIDCKPHFNHCITRLISTIRSLYCIKLQTVVGIRDIKGWSGPMRTTRRRTTSSRPLSKNYAKNEAMTEKKVRI